MRVHPSADVIAIFLFLGIVFTCSMAFAQDSYYIEERVQSNSPQHPPIDGIMKSYIKGDLLRREAPDGVEVNIFRPDRQLVWLINTTRKSYAEIPFEVFRQNAELELMSMMPPGPDGQPHVPDTLYDPTGKTRKIGKWSCKEYKRKNEPKMQGVTSTTTLCVSKETGLPKELTLRIFSITLGKELKPPIQKLLDKITELDGYPVQTTTSITAPQIQSNTTQTLIKVEKRAIPDDIFELPAGYTKINMPTP